MNKIEQAANKQIILLDLYQKYFADFAYGIPHNENYLQEQNIANRRFHRKSFTFEKWFNERMKYIQAEKIYGKEPLQNLKDMGFEINIVDEL